MKVNVFLTSLGALLGCLLGLWVFCVAADKANGWVCGLVAPITFMAAIIPIFGLRYANYKIGINSRVWAVFYLVTSLFLQFGFAAIEVVVQHYVFASALWFVVYLVVLYSLQNADDI